MAFPCRPSLRELCAPLRGLWLFAGVLAGWSWLALPGRWHWGAVVLLVAALGAARGIGSRLAILVGLALQIASFQILWCATPERAPVTCRWAVRVEESGRHLEGTVLAGPAALRGERLRLSPSDLDARPGDTLWLRGTYRPPAPASNPGGFDAGRWMAEASLGGMLRAAGGEPMVVHRAAVRPSRRHLMTDFVHRTLARRLSPPAAALWSSTALGETSFLPPEVSDAFRATGLFHLLAVSGSHMLLLGGAVFAALRLLRTPSSLAWILSCLAVWLYTWLLEWPAPVLRASIAYSVLAAAMAAGRRPHSSNAWFLSGACLLCLDPNSPFHPGVQLSFAAVAGLLWVAPHLEWMLPQPLREGRLAAWFARPLLASLGASLTTAPLLAWHFQAVPWIGIPVGLATALCFEAGFLASLLTLLLSGVGLPLPFFWGFAKAADGLAWICLKTVLWSAERFHGTLDLARPSPGALTLGLALPFALALWGTPWRRLALWSGILWIVAAGMFWFWPHPPALEAWFLDVGQGDAAVLRFPSGRAWLVDCGPRSEMSDAGARVVLPALRTLGIRALDAVVVTHPDMDHAGGLDTLIGALPIGRIFVSVARYPDTPAHWTKTLSRLAAKGIPVRELGAGQKLSYGDGARIDVLAPGRAEAPSTNGASVVLRTEYGRSSLLLAGDAEFWSEKHQLQDGAHLSADLLKVGHHGSRTSSGSEWLGVVRPGLALLSVGAFNRYGHPSPEFLERLRGIGSAPWITSRQGGLRVRVLRNGMQIAAAEPRWWRGPWRRR